MHSAYIEKVVLWGGPRDGAEVPVEPQQLQVFVDGPRRHSSEEILKGRYQYNATTKRYEWMGYE